MGIEFDDMLTASIREDAVFISASIPDPSRWDGEFDALEITDAVVAAARTFLTAGFRLVTAAHPTIAPLLLYVAAEFPAPDDPRVIVYQSALFADVLPVATTRFEAEGVGQVIWTPPVAGESPVPGRWDGSLALMRRQMFEESSPRAACFVGGMEGIIVEHALFTSLFEGRPTYAVGRPGGEARTLARESTGRLGDRLATEDIYPAAWRLALDDLLGSL